MDTKRFREIGAHVAIYEPVAFIRPDKIVLKNHILISEFAYIAGGEGTYVGNFIHIAAHTSLSGGGVCILDDFVGIAAGARLVTGTEVLVDGALANCMLPDKFRKVQRSTIHMQRHSFVATNVVLLPGVTLGEGAVVASGSVVSTDLDPWGVYVGTPPRRVKNRDKTKIVELAQQAYEELGVPPSDFSSVSKL